MIRCVMRLSAIICLICSFSVLMVSGQAAELYLADGDLIQGQLIEIDQNQLTLQTESKTQTVPAAETIRVELGTPVPPQPREGLVILANDDRIHAELLRSDEDFVIVRLNSYPEIGELKIPLETIQTAYFQWPTTRPLRTQLIQKMVQRDQKSDLFYLKNGDYLEGEFLGFDAGTFQFESRAGETSVPRKGIQFFCINPELINFPQPDQLRYRIRLTDGTRLTVSELALHKEMITAKTLFGAKLQCKLNRLVSMTPLGGRSVSLSQLKQTDYQFTPYLSQKWGWQRNRNVLSGPLIVGGQEFASGLGMHSAAELRYPLDGKYVALQTEVGIDDSTDGAGDVDVIILVDRRLVFQQAIRGTDQRTVVVPRIDLTGARELVLKVEFGKNADIQDHLNWCRPVLVLQK